MRLLLAALLLVHGTAMGQTFACQYVEAGGLNWVGGRWQSTLFNLPPPFFLKVEQGVLTTDSAANAMRTGPTLIRCERSYSFTNFSCHDANGNFLVFDPKRSEGGVAKMIGAASQLNDGTRDSLLVSHFTCQQM